MTLPVFWLAELEAVVGEVVTLDGAEGRHAAVVRRIGAGERLMLTDGRGRRATGVVESVAKSGLDVVIESIETEPLIGPAVTVVQAIPKGDRAELTVEVLTEIGVDRIVPWSASRSIGQWRGERRDKALAKWRTTAREAAKQSRRAHFPEVAEPADLAGVIELIAASDLAVVLHEEAAEPIAGLTLEGVSSILLIVGPEGGVSPEEIEAFTAAGARTCLLGPTVLRTSTAGVAGVAALLARTPRWN